MSGVIDGLRQTIPAMLISRRQWVAWRVDERNGKPTKIPINAATGAPAATNRSNTWASFDEACRRWETDGLAGVGYVFSPDDGLTGVDLDKCRDPETGDIEQWAKEIVTELDSYTEISPSKRGLHILLAGKLPNGERRKDRIEMYDRGRYFTVTGDHLAGTPTDIKSREGELWNLHCRVFGGFELPAANDQHTSQHPSALSDHELIKRASSAKNGTKFSRLWNGDWQNEGYHSQSEADAALCTLLAFWADKDNSRIDRLFRRSALYRPKWNEKHFHDGRTYGEETIAQGLALVSQSYGRPINGRRMVEDLKAGAASVGATVKTDERPAIDAAIQDLPTITTLSWQAVERANEPPRLFLFGQLPSRLELNDDGTTRIKELTIDVLRHETARAARWFHTKENRRTGDRKEQDAKPPVDVIKDMLACPDLQLPRLTRIVETPVFGKSGVLLSAAGYHAIDQLYYAPAKHLIIAAVSLAPTQEDIDTARRLLLEDLLGDFPFVSDSSRAHALACLLLPFVRDLIDGPTPLHLIEKPTPRTGGTLLASVLVLPAVGRTVTHVTEAHDTDEWRKVITALLMAGPIAICIDNVRRRLEAASLASALTATVWTDRVLGHSEKVTLPARAVWLATGNNPSLSDEILGRTVFIRLDARLDRPQDRTQFRHPLPEWASQRRADLIQAALTLCQAWIAAGRPTGEHRKGGFEEWSAVLGGILGCVGVPGFLTERESEFADPEAQAWLAFVRIWWADYKEKAVGVSDLFKIVNPTVPTHADLLDIGLGDGSVRSQQIRLGKRLIEQRDRQFSVEQGYRLQIIAAGTQYRAQLWKLKAVPCEGSPVNVVNVSECFSTQEDDQCGNNVTGSE
jgi:hypothetical protein